MQFSLNGIKYPTPTAVKHAVDSINLAFGASGLASIVMGYPHGALITACISFILKGVSNFYFDAPPPDVTSAAWEYKKSMADTGGLRPGFDKDGV